MAPAISRRTLPNDHRAAVSVLTGLMAPGLLLFVAMIVDGGFWIMGSTNLQVAADAAAMGAAQLLTSSLRTQSTATQNANLAAVAKFEAQNAATKLVGTMNAPTVTLDPNYTYVSVTVTSQAPGFFNAISTLVAPDKLIAAPLLRATATATIKGGPKPCLLTLGTTGQTIEVDGSGTLAATSCPIYANSNGTPAIHATGSGSISESGTISGTDIGAVGTISSDNGGSISAQTITPNGKSVSDPVAGTYTTPVAPTPYASSNTYNAGGATYNLTASSWNGDVSFSNSVNVNFAAGVYYVNNGSLTFNGANVTFATGVSFVITGTNPGNFSWTNYTNSTNPLTAPTSGNLAGIALYLGCNGATGNQSASFAGGSSLTVSGTMYMPCAAANLSNNVKISAASGAQFGFISKTLTVTGSAKLLTTAGTTASATNSGPVLTQ